MNPTKLHLLLLVAASTLGAAPYEVTDILTASTTQDSRSTEWKPGDGVTLEVGGLAWLGGDTDRLAVAIRKGEIWFLDHALGDPEKVTYHRFASGLHEPLGLLPDGDDLVVVQRPEATRLSDRDGDGVADSYLTETDGWLSLGNYHAYAYGPETDGKGQRWITLNLAMGGAKNDAGWRGWGGTISQDGRFQPQCFGMRSPCGLGANLAGDIFFTDQQGTWIPATPLYHLRPGVFYGNQEALATQDLPGAPFKLSQIPPNRTPYPEALKAAPEFVPPAVWLPYNKMGRSGTDVQAIPNDAKFGPFGGQLLVGEFTNAAISRVFLEKVDGEYQGACFPFLDRFPSAVLRLAFAPDGALFVGMTNRGWSSLGNRSYGLSRVRHTGETPFAVKEMRARPDGFELRFTRPAKKETLAGLRMLSYTYLYSSAYGSDEIDTKEHKLLTASLSDDGLTAQLKIEGLREGYVYELHLDGLTDTGGTPLDHPRAYYTLNRIPAP